jgi:drug/metabolite transporter (DMT)-like permease
MPSPKVLVSIGILAVICTAVAFILFAALIKEIGPVRSTVITYINPAVAAVLGILVLNETFTLAMGAGLALVILGSILATRRPTVVADRRPPTPEPISAASAEGSNG